MKTSKPISTISYNTLPYLMDRLSDLVKAKKVSFYAFVCHKAEDDEGGKKDHIHVYLEPSKLIQTDDIKDFFKEIDLRNPSGKPLGCMSFRSSKFSDWYMYGIHNAAYLASKGQSRRFHYAYEDVISSDEDELLMLVRSIDLSDLTPIAKMKEAQEQGMYFSEYVAAGFVPVAQVRQYSTVWNILSHVGTIRNGRANHEAAEETSSEFTEDDAYEGFTRCDDIDFS